MVLSGNAVPAANAVLTGSPVDLSGRGRLTSGSDSEDEPEPGGSLNEWITPFIWMNDHVE